MPGDYDSALVTARCSRCARPVAAAFAELRETGVFACVCGTMTRARYAPPVEATPFSQTGWRRSGDAYASLR
jgi:hypothetical protein